MSGCPSAPASAGLILQRAFASSDEDCEDNCEGQGQPWAPEPLFQQVADASDATFITAPNGPEPSLFRLKLAPLSPPADKYGSHVLTVRLRNPEEAIARAEIRLLQGGATIAMQVLDPEHFTTDFTNYTLELSSGEIDLITDYGDLWVEVSVTPLADVGTDAADEEDCSQAKLHGTLDDMGCCESVVVLFEIAGNSEMNDSVEVTAAQSPRSEPGAFDATVSGLDCSTPYWFRAVARCNDNGVDVDDVVGGVESFTTEDCAECSNGCTSDAECEAISPCLECDLDEFSATFEECVSKDCSTAGCPEDCICVDELCEPTCESDAECQGSNPPHGDGNNPCLHCDGGECTDMCEDDCDCPDGCTCVEGTCIEGTNDCQE